MASIAGAITQAQKARGREYTPKQKKFLTLFAKNDFKDPRVCAEKSGYKSDYWMLITSLKDDIKLISESVLIGAAPEAAMALTNILSSEKPVPNAQTKLQAAREVLDRTGIVREEKHQHEHNVSGGVFLLPVKHEIIQEEDDVYIEGEYEEA